MNVRVRGIYATALTRLFEAAGHDVVQASPSIRERFDADLPAAPADAVVESTDDHQGVVVSGDPDAVGAAREMLVDVGIDALAWTDPAPRGAVFDATVTETLGGGAVVDIGDREGYLPFGAVEDRIEDGDDVRVQVHEPEPAWTGDRPLVGTARRANGGLATLRNDLDGTVVDADEDAANEVAGLADLLDVETPPSWGVEWAGAAVDADLDAMGDALARAGDRATDLIGLPDDRDPPRGLVAPETTAWVRFGRGSRFALDGTRQGVTVTMPGHHRIKAGGAGAGNAVDFLEAVCPDGAGRAVDGEFPFAAVADRFGPREGDRVAIEHGKPDGRGFPLGRGEVVSLDSDGSVTLRRHAGGRGTYDALGTERERGDVATTRLQEGRWWYITRYAGEDGTDKGTYANVCTPVEVFPDAVRYVDLHVDVVKHPDGTVERVDDDELDEAVAAGHIDEELAEKARDVASRLEGALAD
ncbi:MAG: DUF402 domain-containing protein [Halobacteriales archaeon]